MGTSAFAWKNMDAYRKLIKSDFNNIHRGPTSITTAPLAKTNDNFPVTFHSNAASSPETDDTVAKKDTKRPEESTVS